MPIYTALALLLLLPAVAAAQALGTAPDAPMEISGTRDETCRPGREKLKGNGMSFIRICAGTFTMGSEESGSRATDEEKPAHEVTLREFWIGQHEITNEQYRSLQPDHPGEAALPAIGVSWFEAKAFCESLEGGRLPTEAEWEYAARAGSQTAWSFGDDETLVAGSAWHGDGFDDALRPVGQKEPNAWGLHDMHGNVWEWVADWHGAYPDTPQTDPRGPAEGEYRVLRGGSFLDAPAILRSAFRGRMLPGGRDWDTGFRCVVSPRRQL